MCPYFSSCMCQIANVQFFALLLCNTFIQPMLFTMLAELSFLQCCAAAMLACKALQNASAERESVSQSACILLLYHILFLHNVFLLHLLHCWAGLQIYQGAVSM